MGDHPQQDLVLLVDPLGGSQGRPEPPLGATEPALHLPPLAVDPLRPRAPRFPPEPPHHLTPVLGLGPLPAPAPVQRDDRGPDAQLLAGRGVVLFRVVRRVAQQGIDRHGPDRVPGRRDQVRGVLTRAAGDPGGQVQMAPGVDDGGQFRPPLLVDPSAGPPGEVAADGPGLVPGRVGGRARLVGDEPPPTGRRDGLAQEGCRGLFLSSRSAAFWRVEWSGMSPVSPSAARRSDQSRRCCSMPR